MYVTAGFAFENLRTRLRLRAQFPQMAGVPNTKATANKWNAEDDMRCLH